jgi:HK97 family phage prohead protease
MKRNIEHELIALGCPGDLAKRTASRYGRSGVPTGDAPAISSERSIVATVRAEGDGKEFVLEGRAARYGVQSSMLPPGFREVIQRGAFARALQPGSDIKALYQHDASKVLGRTTAGTLRIFEDRDGLCFRCQLDPNQQLHRDLHSAVLRGDVNEMSFGFRVPSGGDDWQEGIDTETGAKIPVRNLKSIDCTEVSVCSFPAYNKPGSTSAEARSVSVTLPGPQGEPLSVDVHPSNVELAQEIAEHLEDAELRRRVEEIGRELRS